MVKFLRAFSLILFLTVFSPEVWAKTQTLTIMLDWFINPNHAPLLVGVEEGIFAKHGLDVKLIAPADAADPGRFVTAGKVDLALTYEPQWLIQQHHGLPLVWIATLVDQPLAAVIANAKQVSNIKALKGKAIGYSEGAVGSAFLDAMLHHQGLSTKDVQLINVHYDLVQALLANRVVAISGAMRNVEPVELKENHFSYQLFYPEDYGVPVYAELIFVARQDHQQDARFKAFIAALSESIAYLKKHPEATWQVFALSHPALNNETNHHIWLDSVKYFTNHPDRFNQKQEAKLEAFLQQQKVL